MKKIGFIIRISVLENLKHPKIAIVMIVSMMVGLLIPCVVLGFWVTAFQQRKTIHTPNAERIAVFSFHAPIVSNDIFAQITEVENVESLAAATWQTNLPVSWNGHTASVTAHFSTEQTLLDFWSPQIVSGRMITPDEWAQKEKVCVVEENFLFNYGEINVGDKLNLGDNDFLVVGIIRLYPFRNMVFFPMEFCPPLGDISQTLYLKYARLPAQLESVSGRLQEIIPGIRSASEWAPQISDLGDRQKSTEQLLWFTVSGILAESLILLIYAVVNILFVLTGKIRLKQKQLGIKIAIGAKRADIMLDILTETLLYTIAALIPLPLLVPFVSKYVPSNISVTYNVQVYFATLGLGVLICLILSSIVTAKIARQQAVQMIRGE